MFQRYPVTTGVIIAILIVVIVSVGFGVICTMSSAIPDDDHSLPEPTATPEPEFGEHLGKIDDSRIHLYRFVDYEYQVVCYVVAWNAVAEHCFTFSELGYSDAKMWP